MKLAELQEARYYGTPPILAWTMEALKRFKGPTLCIERKHDDDPMIDVKNFDTVLDDFKTHFGNPDSSEYDDQHDYHEHQWIVRRTPVLVVELFTYGHIEEERKIGVCIAGDDDTR